MLLFIPKSAKFNISITDVIIIHMPNLSLPKYSGVIATDTITVAMAAALAMPPLMVDQATRRNRSRPRPWGVAVSFMFGRKRLLAPTTFSEIRFTQLMNGLTQK
jgi:hypothetical protein